jgi:hypothetical protein
LGDPKRFEFDPDRLDPRHRKDGISAFLPVRDGEPFVGKAIESHLPYLNEIVVVHNRCTDATPEILDELASRHPDKLRVIHYEPPVFAHGTEGHADSPPDSVHSLINYSNYAMSMTSRRIVMKFDDDHVAIGPNLAREVERIRRQGLGRRRVIFSGLNLLRDPETKEVGVFANNPVAGSGDHWFIEASPESHFIYDERYEGFTRPRHGWTHCGFLYYHLRFLKPGFGFANRDLADNPQSRYHAQLESVRNESQYQAFDGFVKSCPERRASLAGAQLGVFAPNRLLGRLIGSGGWRRLALRRGDIHLLRALHAEDDFKRAPTPAELGIT